MAEASTRSDRAWAATRKGLFELRRGANGDWRIERLQHVDAAVGLQRVGQGGVLAAPAVDEHRHVGAQMVLVVEHVAAQIRALRKSVLERCAQRRGLAVYLGDGQEAAQLGREGDVGHVGMMRRRVRGFKRARWRQHPHAASAASLP